MLYYVSSAEMAGRAGFGLPNEGEPGAQVEADYRAMAQASLGDQADYLEYCSLSTVMQILLTQRILAGDPFEHSNDRCGLILGQTADPSPLRKARAIAARSTRAHLTQSLFREIDDHFWIRSFRFGSAHASLQAAQCQGPTWILEAPLREGAAVLDAIEDAFNDGEVAELLVLGSDTEGTDATPADVREASKGPAVPWAVALRVRRAPRARAMRLSLREPEAVPRVPGESDAKGSFSLREVARNFLLRSPWSAGRFCLEPLSPEETQ